MMFISHMTRTHLVERFRRLLGGPVPHVQAAALPWRRNSRGKVEILLVTSRDTGRWILPKGWPEGDETLCQSALREAREEAGISGAIGSKSIGSYFYDKILPTGMGMRCEVHVFPINVEKVGEKWPEKGKRVRNWVSPEKAARMVNEPDLAELISDFSGNPRDIAA